MLPPAPSQNGVHAPQSKRTAWEQYILLASILIWSGGAFLLDTWGKTRTAHGPYEAILVAGCRVYPDGRPSPALEWRVRKAVDLWKQNQAPLLVFTGGLGEYPPTEALASSRLAESLGVPKTAILLEEDSKTTLENARNAAAKIPNAHTARVLLVTDAYHVFRARRLFARYFGEVDAVGSTYGVGSRIRGAFREVLALVKFALTSLLDGSSAQ